MPKLRWPNGEPALAVYICEHCEQEIHNHQKHWMLPRGHWRAAAPGQGKAAGFHLSSLYSPVGWFSWADAAEMFTEAQKNPALLQVFVNTVLGETWKQRGEAPEWQRLYGRKRANATKRSIAVCMPGRRPPCSAWTGSRRSPGGVLKVSWSRRRRNPSSKRGPLLRRRPHIGGLSAVLAAGTGSVIAARTGSDEGAHHIALGATTRALYTPARQTCDDRQRNPLLTLGNTHLAGALQFDFSGGLMRLSVALLIVSVAFAGEISFTFAGLTLTPEPWNKEANFVKLERYARQAAAQGAQVIAAPEGFLEGYVGNKGRSPGLDREKYFSVGEEIDGPFMRRIAMLARELKVYLLVGYAERRKDRMYNSTAIFSPDGSVAGHYSKSHTADDEPYNTKGTEFPVFPTPFGRWGTLICFDRQLPETARTLALRGAQLILVPAWGAYGEINDIMMRVRAYENGVWLAFVHPKRCLIIDPRGRVIAKDSGEFDQVVTATIRIDPAARQTLLERRRPELYEDIVNPQKARPSSLPPRTCW
jgi:predicted amidohydrolase